MKRTESPGNWAATVAIILLLVAVAPADVNLLVMGDWGGGEAQPQVAAAMAGYVEQSGESFSAVLTAGDNFYPKLSGIDDPQWQSLFERMYDPRRLNLPFYVTLGNHDMDDGKMAVEFAYAAAHPSSRWKLPARWYRLNFPPVEPLVSVLMLDSNKKSLTAQQWKTQLAWMDEELSRRPGKWLIVVAHHPLFSNGDHGDNGELQRDWKPLLEKHKPDLYVCGHDHDLQHLEIPGLSTSLLIAGGGGKNIRPMRNDQRGPFSKSTYGFAHLQISESMIQARLIDAQGAVIHQFDRAADGAVRITQTQPSDVAKPRSVKSVTRPDLSNQPATQPATTR